MNLRERITSALDTSDVRGNQVDAVMTVVLEEINDRVRLARRRDTLDRMVELGAPEAMLAEQRRMIRDAEEKLGEDV